MNWRSLPLGIALVVGIGTRLAAQCPDGSAPPCHKSSRAGPVDTNALAILPFRISTPTGDESWLTEAIPDLLSIAIDGVAGWRVVHPRTVLARARNYRDPADPQQALLLSRGVGAGRFVIGTGIAVGGRLRVHAELYDAPRGRRLAVIDAIANPRDLASAADSIAVGIMRTRLSASPGLLHRPVREYTTASPPALRAFLAAEKLARASAWQAAAESLVHAINLDSTFGLAYYRLSIAIGADARVGVENWSMESAAAAGLRHVGALPRRQQSLLLAAAALFGRHPDALSRADDLGRSYPDDPEALFLQGDIYYHRGMPLGKPLEAVLEPLERALTLDSTLAEARHHAIALRFMMGDAAGAWALLRQARASGEPFVGLELAARAGLRGENPAGFNADGDDPAQAGRPFLEAARHTGFVVGGRPARAIGLVDSFATLAARSQYPRTVRVSAFLIRAQIRAGQGRLTQAWDALRQADSLDGETKRVLNNMMFYSINTGRHLERVRAAARKVATDSTSNKNDQLTVATYAAEIGDSSLLAQSLTSFDSLTAPQEPGDQADHARVLAFAALQAGDTARARQLFESALQLSGTGEFAYLDMRASLALARLTLAAGAADVAEQVLRRPERMLGPFSMPLIPLTYRAQFDELRGRIAEERGDTATAVRSYRTFVELWKNCDPDLRPRVVAAHAALQRLERR